MDLPVFADVKKAQQKIASLLPPTPIVESAILNNICGGKLVFKCENLQQTGSFKIRGALNRLLSMSKAECQSGVVAFSSGNHAQGIARAAKLLGINATIVMPEDAPDIKISNTRKDGAKIVTYDRYRESREDIAASIAARSGAILVPSFDDAHIIAGQGTVGLELFNAIADAKTVLCPVSGGGLMAGIGLARDEICPDTKLIGVEPEGYDDHAQSLKARKIIRLNTEKPSLCDALLSPAPGELTFAINKNRVADIFTASDSAIRDAIRLCYHHLGLVVEPGGAAGLAAILENRRVEYSDKKTVVILSGGNMDTAMLHSILSSPYEILLECN